MNEDITTIYIEYQDETSAEFFIYPYLENLKKVDFEIDTEAEDFAIGDGSESEEGFHVIVKELKWSDVEPTEKEKEAVIDKIKEVYREAC